MDVPAILTYALTLTVTLKYILVFLGTVLEGPVIMVACGFLIHLGFFDPIPVYLTILAGDLVGDIGWYYIGYYFAEPFMRKHGHFMSITPEKYERIKGLFHTYHERILFFSKVTIGLGLSLGVLVVAGATRIPFKKYMIINLIGEAVLVTVLLTIGYFFGELFKYVDGGLKIGFMIGVAALVIGGVYGFTSYMKKKVNTL